MNPITPLVAIGTLFGYLSVYADLILVIAVVVLGFSWPYYEAVLKEAGKDRDGLLERLAKGGDLRTLYINAITTLLDRVDKFLGDAGQGQRWVARLFGLKGLQPCWTGRSFDTYALLCIVYPLASIIITWLLAGDAGPIGELLLLHKEPDWWTRLISALALVAILLLYHRFANSGGRSLFWLAVTVAVGGVATSVGANIVVAVFAFAVGLVFARDVVGGHVMIFGTLFVGCLIIAGGYNITLFLALVGFGYTVGIPVELLEKSAARKGRLGTFWLLYWPIALGAAGLCFWLNGRLGTPIEPVWMDLLVLISVLPLINLVFGWASIGVTRALLRRGCEGHGIWVVRSPTLLGLSNFLLGLGLLAALAVVIVVALSVVDVMLLHTGSRPDQQGLDVVALIDQIASQPDNPAHYWVYFTLVTTLLPSFLNLLVAVSSLLAFSVPPVRRWLITTIPRLEGSGVGGTRFLAVFALSGQWFCGVLLTGFGLWLVWRGVLMVPGVERMALVPLHTFAVWCAHQLGLPQAMVT